MSRFIDVNFTSSAATLDTLPPASLPEVAFAGRSNVGKSSLLNALVGRNGFFRVSRTPGRTRTIIHAEARLDGGGRLYLVDLPGYGYAEVSKSERRAWSRVMGDYLVQRDTLCLVVLLVDIRRGPQDEEAALAELLAEGNRPGLLVATKLDKLVKSQRRPALEALSRTVGMPVLGTSAETGDGVPDLCQRVAKACGFFP